MPELLLPLFPLQVVLLPEEPLPLHIFEERYKQLIGECLEAKTTGRGQQEFGVLLMKGQEVQNVGCCARIVNVTRKHADGRMDILTIGTRRFEVLFTDEERPYLRGGVEFFDDEADSDTPEDDDAKRAIELFRGAMRRLRQSSKMPIHLSKPYRHLSFRIAAPLPFDLDFKQTLLPLRRESERLHHVTRGIELLMAQVNLLERAQAKSKGNGHFQHGKTE